MYNRINKNKKLLWIGMVIVSFTIMSISIENLVLANKYVGNAKAIAKGKKVYMASCAMCHMADLKSGLSNLLAPKLKYGNSAKSIMKVIKNGTNMGMPPQSFLGKKKISQVTAYIISVRKKKK